MLKSIALAAAIGASTVLMSAGAGAYPLAQGKAAIGASDEMLLVREGCGPGWQFSNRQRRCVPDSYGAQRRDFRRDTYRCGRGLVWSDRMRRCVFIR